VSTVPIFAPDGTLGDIPPEQLPAAVKAGATPGVHFKSPDGTLGVIPANKTHDAVLAGGQNPISIAVDAANVYYGDYSGGSGSIRRVPRNGGSVQTVFFSGSSWYPQAIRVDSDNVYFRARLGAAPKKPKKK